MLRLVTRIEGIDGISGLGAGRDYGSLDDAVRDAARAAGSLLTDDISAGHQSVALKLIIETESGARAAAIELAATVTLDGAAKTTRSQKSGKRLFNM